MSVQINSSSPIVSINAQEGATIETAMENTTVTITGGDSTVAISGTIGLNGADGAGVPIGGTSGQILAKNSGTDYDTLWIDAPSGGGATYTAGNGLILTGSAFEIDPAIVATDADLSNALANYTPSASLSSVATSGDYNDLSGLPTLFDGAYASLSGAPTLSTVATSGSYADLSNTPDLGAYVLSASLSAVATSGNYADLSGLPTLFDGAYSSLSGTPALSLVATSGLYSDLNGTPTLFSGSYTDLTNKPAIHNVASGGTSGQILAKNSATDYDLVWITPSAGTAYSAGDGLTLTGDQFAIDPSIVTTDTELASQLANYTLTSALSPVATSGSYTDLINQPALFSGSYTDLTGAPTLSTVATSGLYSDLSGTPTLSAVATSGSYSDLSNQPAIHNVIAGGTSGQILAKNSGSDYDLAWIDAPSGSGGTTYSAGDGILINSDVLAVDTSYVATQTDMSNLTDYVAGQVAGVTHIFTTQIGDGSTTSFDITHNLNKLLVLVNVYTNDGNNLQVYPNIKLKDFIRVTIEFATAPTTDQYSVVVVA